MPEYLITLPSGKRERCTRPGNCRRHGAYAATAVRVGAAERNAFLHDVQQAHPITPAHLREGIYHPPVVVPLSPLHEPTDKISNGDFEVDYDAGSSDDGYDYYNDEDYYTEGGDGMNRTGTIENLRIEQVDLPAVLAAMFNCKEEQLPKNLIDYAANEGVADPENWYIHIEGGYYGEELGNAELQNPKVLENLKAWYWQQPNANDADGILNYCRGKGVDTTGMNPLQAIQTQLAQENPGIHHHAVDSARKVYATRLNHSQVRIPRRDRLAEITGRPATIPAEMRGTGANQIVGVLHHSGGAYRMVDGYHRYKDATETRTRSGRYIILES